MPKHDHTPPVKCDHELKHCDHCDVVFCEKCDREWKRPAAQVNMADLYRECEKNNRPSPWDRSFPPLAPYTQTGPWPTATWSEKSPDVSHVTVEGLRPPTTATAHSFPHDTSISYCHGKGA